MEQSSIHTYIQLYLPKQEFDKGYDKIDKRSLQGLYNLIKGKEVTVRTISAPAIQEAYYFLHQHYNKTETTK